MFHKLFQKRHSRNTAGVIRAAFPASLGEDVKAALKAIPVMDGEPHVEDSASFRCESEVVTVPYRVHFLGALPAEYEHLTAKRRAILAAIYTRHSSGHQREAWAIELSKDPSPWTAPFLAFLLEDYVQEIFAAIDRVIDVEAWHPLMLDLGARNPEWVRSMNHRVLTAWDRYYRAQTPSLIRYPGYRLVERLGLWDRKTAPRVLRASRRMERHGGMPPSRRA